MWATGIVIHRLWLHLHLVRLVIIIHVLQLHLLFLFLMVLLRITLGLVHLRWTRAISTAALVHSSFRSFLYVHYRLSKVVMVVFSFLARSLRSIYETCNITYTINKNPSSPIKSSRGSSLVSSAVSTIHI